MRVAVMEARGFRKKVLAQRESMHKLCCHLRRLQASGSNYDHLSSLLSLCSECYSKWGLNHERWFRHGSCFEC